MKYRHFQSLLFLFMLILAALVASCNLIIDGDDDAYNERQAQCKITNLTLDPSGIMLGGVTKIRATVSSVDDKEGIYTAIFYIEEDEVYCENVLIQPGEEITVSFQLTGESVGSYRVRIEKASEVLTVYEWSKYTLKYDNGEAYGIYFLTGETGHIVHFMPESKPFIIQKITIYMNMVVEAPRDLDVRYITLRIWNKDKSQLLWTQEYPWRELVGGEGWKELEVPDVLVIDDFHVELVTGSQGIQRIEREEVTNYIAIGWDRPSPKTDLTAPVTKTRSGVSNMGILLTTPNVMHEGIRWFIRTEGKCAPLVLAYDDGGDEEWHWTNGNYNVLFAPPALPFTIKNIAIYGYARAKDAADYRSKKATVRIKQEANGAVLWQGDFDWSRFELDNAKWVMIKIPDIECNGMFYVDVITYSTDENSCIKIGIDYSNRNRHSSLSSDVLLKPGFSGQLKGSEFDSDSANWMIRVEGVYIVQTF